jgi:hypothetical protein
MEWGVGFTLEELADQRVAGGFEFGRGAIEHDAAVGDHHRAIGDGQGFVHVMGDNDAGQAQAVVEP